MKADERIACCCICCENVKLLVAALNNQSRNPGHHNLHIAPDDIYKNLVCPFQGDPAQGPHWPAKKCLEDSCSKCGIKIFLMIPLRSMIRQWFSTNPGSV